jgi:hypothetical protein
MLNLSDNELDRLSREAASQHDPGDLFGSQAWERLEVRLDKELGKAGPPDGSRGFRGFRRLPFQYAPMILLIVGVSYYFVKQATKGRKAENSGSPPLTVVKTPQQQPGSTASDSSLKNPVYSDKSTSTPYHQDQSQNIDPVTTAGAPTGAASTAASGRQQPAAIDKADATTGASAGTSSNPKLSSPGSKTTSPDGKSISSNTKTSLSGSNKTSAGSKTPDAKAISDINTLAGNTSSNKTGAGAFTQNYYNTHNNNTRNRGRHNPANQDLTNKSPGSFDGPSRGSSTGSTNGQNSTAADLTAGSNRHSSLAEPAGPERTFIQRVHSQRSGHPTISDSALRKLALTAQTPTNPGKKNGPSLRVNRSLSIGFQLAPDFSSVNALAGDKPGSSFGLTIDYQFANRLHLNTGLLFTKKNYTARAADYHVPDVPGPWGYYGSIGIYKPVDFVKGSMTMLEIPLNLRYDFSITGNTVFFASGGFSTYLLGSERAKYYFEAFRQEVYKVCQYDNKSSILSTANLSLGVETGISNELSILVAPYMKLPVGDLGFGKIRMNSVGINVGIRYSPVISRKRQH